MKKIRTKVWNRIEMTKDTIATELPSTAPNLRRWVAILPKMESYPSLPPEPEHLYYILEFELDKGLIDEYFGDSDMLNQKRYYIKDQEELYKVLEEIGVDPELFDAPWHCDYPF